MHGPLPETLSKKPSLKSGGQILLSILIAIAVFSILTHALFTLISASFDFVNFNRARITARHLAQEKMELARNLSYSDVGTIGGIPSGVIEPEENTEINGLNYTINTTVVYIDDPYDNTAPDDTSPEDYKRVKIEVSWEGLAGSNKNPVILLTDISEYAISQTEAGSLVIVVTNANGDPLPNAQVSIVSNSVDPPVNTTIDTNSEGRVVLPGAEECIECYEITVTRDGYSTDRTYSTSEVSSPIKPHASVFEDQVTQLSFAIDQVGTINIASVDNRENNFAPLGDVNFRIHGDKLIGTDGEGQPVYKYDETLSTNSSGDITLNNMEWDLYQVVMPTTTSYDISGTDPLLPLSLLPAGTADFTFAVEPHTSHSFFAIVKDSSQNLIASASARLFDGSGYDETQLTGQEGNPDHGQTLFSNLEEKTYQVEATASGFLDFSGEFDVSGYTIGDIILTSE